MKNHLLTLTAAMMCVACEQRSQPPAGSTPAVLESDTTVITPPPAEAAPTDTTVATPLPSNTADPTPEQETPRPRQRDALRDDTVQEGR